MHSARSNKVAEKLRLLGLTANETRAYLAVLKLGLCRVNEIARETHLHRPELYHTMPRLRSLGLVEETLDRPKRYKATPIQNAMNLLTEATLGKYRGIADGTKDLVTELEAIQSKIEEKIEGQVRVVVGMENMRRNFREVLNSAQSEVWIIRGLAPFTSRSDTNFFLETVSAKRLKARSIYDIDESNIHVAKRLASVVDVRHYHPVIVHVFGVDNRYVGLGLATAANSDPEKISELVTDYPDYVKTIREFFDATWKQATPLKARIAMLRGHDYHHEQTRIIWGREAIFKETSDWHLRAKRGISEITTQSGPSRLWANSEKQISEARAMKLKWRLVCNVTPENKDAIRKLSAIADVRLVERPHGVGIVVLDDSEAMIHYIDPDSADLNNSPTDLALVTSDRSVARNLFLMVDSVWKHAKPLKPK